MSLPDPTDPLGLAGFVNNADMSDVVMIVGGQKIFAHRFILGARSPVFHRMLFGQFEEGKSKEVVLKDEIITPEDFLLFLKFAYTGNFQPTPENVLGIFYLAKVYEIHGLAKICTDYVSSVMGPENAITLCDSALHIGADEMLKTCMKFIEKNTADCLLSVTDVATVSASFMIQLVSSEKLSCDEGALFNFVKIWCETHPDDPKAKEIISQVRLPLMTQEQLMKVVKPSGLVSIEEYLEALEYTISPGDCAKKAETESRFKPRGPRVLHLWDPKYCSRSVSILGHQITAGSSGAVLLKNTVYSFKVTFQMANSRLMIGFIARKNWNDEGRCFRPGYFLYLANTSRFFDRFQNDTYPPHSRLRIPPGSVVEARHDKKARTISYIINDKDYGTAFITDGEDLCGCVEFLESGRVELL